MRRSCLVVFGASFFIAIATFKQLFGFSYSQSIALFIVYIIWPLGCVPIYVISQLILVFRTLEDRWPIGDIIFGTAFYAGGQVLLFAFSVTICNAIQHYIDGLFFFTLCVLLSVMMFHKYWDSITVRFSRPPVWSPSLICCIAISERILNFQSVLKLLFGKSKILYWLHQENIWTKIQLQIDIILDRIYVIAHLLPC